MAPRKVCKRGGMGYQQNPVIKTGKKFLAALLLQSLTALTAVTEC